MKYFYTLTLTCLSLSINAQILPIDTDRPDQTESAFLVPAKWLQFEAGFNFQKNNKDEKEYLTPTLLSKYGVSKWIELRLITTLKTNSSLTTFGTKNETGLDVAELGAKIALAGERKLFPKTSFIFQLGIPSFSSSKFKPDRVAPNFRFTMQHTLSEKISLGYNLGCEWDGYTNDPDYIYTVTLGYAPAKKWYTYIEAFGAFKKQITTEHNIDSGIAYFISNNFKTDISAGMGFTGNAAQWYIALGVSVRFNTNRN